MSRLKMIVLLIASLVLADFGFALSTPSPTQTDEEIASLFGDAEPDDTDERTHFLRVTSPLRNISVTSGNKMVLKCKVDGYPKDSMTYQWYKDNKLLTPNDDERIDISNKPNQSRLRFVSVYSLDSGLYRCEASNGERRVHTEAYATVSFKKPPPSEPILPDKFKGKCETYTGEACQSILAGKSIYVDPLISQQNLEDSLKLAFAQLSAEASGVSEQCMLYAYPTFCKFVFSSCDYKFNVITGKNEAQAIRLCREDCERMKYDVCKEDLKKSKPGSFLQIVFRDANCTDLPATNSEEGECANVGLPAIIDEDQTCYDGDGSDYRGTANRAQGGRVCQSWKTEDVEKFPELAGGHNYCRNPNKEKSAPWCYVDSRRRHKVLCDVQTCSSSSSSGTDMIVILIPSVSIPFVIACIFVAFCVCKRRKRGNRKNATPQKSRNVQSGIPLMEKIKSKVPDLPSNSVQLLNEIGDGQYGKVYKGKVLPNPLFSTNFAVAVKTLREGSLPQQVEDFQREIDVFAELQHENVASLKAIVTNSSLRCMIFENTNGVDLHEYLVLHSPQADFAKPPISSASSHASSTIEQTDFIRMAIQVASGMEYLASNNFVHKDVAARNILVCSSMDLKISNLGVMRDSCLSSYYRSPQGGQLVPIRWMAPESLQNWQVSNKTSIWSFGVLLWEMFSYGMQPYCGYNNHEVLEMISRRQLLSCPDQCPAKVYSLMHECWFAQPSQRPSFKDLRAKLQGWEGSSTGRVTSQLAQGIHRQLTNVMRDGPNQFSQYTSQGSSLGGSSGITYSSNLPGPTPSPPPQYVSNIPHPNSSASTFMTTQQPLPPNVSPSSQQFFSSPGTNVSAMNPYQGAYPAPVSTGGVYGEGYQPQMQQYSQYNQRKPPNYRKGPPSHSSIGSSSSSSREYPPVRPTYNQTTGFNGHDVSSYEVPQQHHHAAYGQHLNRPLSGVMETENDEEEEAAAEEEFYKKQNQNTDSEQLVVSAARGNHPVGGKDSKPVSPSSGHFPEIDSSDMSTSSMKATSCDSGLPTEDVEGHQVDPKTPLMGRGQPRNLSRTPARGPTPRKFV